MKVYWTPEARERLRDIEAYIAQDAPKVARQVVERLLERSMQLNVAPESGRRVPEYPEADLRELLVRPYRVIYRIVEDQVEVLSVMHFRQRLPRRVGQLR